MEYNLAKFSRLLAQRDAASSHIQALAAQRRLHYGLQREATDNAVRDAHPDVQVKRLDHLQSMAAEDRAEFGIREDWLTIAAAEATTVAALQMEVDAASARHAPLIRLCERLERHVRDQIGA